MQDTLQVLAFFGPFWLTVLLLSGSAIFLSYRRRARERELGADMIREMLGRKMTAEEIERVLVAWNGRSRATQKFVREQQKAAGVALGKPAPSAG